MMGAVQDLLGRIRNRNSEAPQSANSVAESNYFGYTEQSLESRMLKAYEAGQDSRVPLAADAAAAGEGDDLAAARFGKQYKADLHTVTEFHNDWRGHEVTSPAQLRGLTDVAEIYGRWQDADPRISNWIPRIDQETSATNSPVEEQAGQARHLPIQLPLLEDIRGKYTWENPREWHAQENAAQLGSAALRVPADGSVDTPAQALAREYLSSVNGIFSVTAAAAIADQINAGEADQIRTTFGPSEPVWDPHQETVHQARELIANTLEAGGNNDLEARAPALASEHEAVVQSVQFLGHDGQWSDPVMSSLYARANELDVEAASLTREAHEAYDYYQSDSYLERDTGALLGPDAVQTQQDDVHASFTDLTNQAAEKTAEAQKLRSEAAARRENAPSIADRSGRWDSEIREPSDEVDGPGKASVVERARQVKSEVRELSEARDLQQREAPSVVRERSKNITA